MRRRLFLLAATFLALPVSACFTPELPAQIACGQDGECPPGSRCEATVGLCVPADQAPIAKLRFLTAPAAAEALVETSPVTLELLDAHDERVVLSGGSVALDVAANPAGVTLVTPTHGTAASGIVTFAGVELDRPGRAVHLVARGGALSATSPSIDVRATRPVVTMPVTNDNLASCATVPYVLTQAQSLPVDLRVEVDPDGPDGPAPYRPATQAASEPGLAGVSGVPGKPGGANQTFSWNTTADLPSTDTVGTLRITPSVHGVDGTPAVKPVTIRNRPSFLDVPIVDYPLCSGDINQDGWIDFVSVNASLSTIPLPQINLPVPEGVPVIDMTIGDFDGNGLRDLAVALSTVTLVALQQNDAQNRYVTFALNDSAPFRTVVAADFDHDGIDELAGVQASNGAVVILEGSRAAPGQLVERARPWVASDTGELLVADLDHDGWLDLVIGRTSATSPIAIVRGSAGGWRPATTDSGLDGNSLAVADLDEDGRDDIASVDGQGLHVVTATGRVDLPAITGEVLAFADMDRDGRMDLVTSSAGFVREHLHVGARGVVAFAPPLTLGAAPGTVWIYLGDIDLDGQMDVYAVSAGTSHMFMNLSARRCGGRLSGAIDSIGNLVLDSTFADWNGDGKLDALGVIDGNTVVPSRVVVVWGRGDGTFTFAPLSLFEYPYVFGRPVRQLHPADYDLDSAMDIALVLPPADTITFLYGDPAEHGDPMRIDLPTNITAELVESADLDGDGVPDLLVAGSGQLQIRHGGRPGTRSFAAPIVVSTSVDVSDTSCDGKCKLLLDDVDRDGQIDLVLWSAGQLLLFRADAASKIGFAAPLVIDHPPGRLLTAANLLVDGRRTLLARFDAPQQLVAYALDASASTLEKVWDGPVDAENFSTGGAAATDLDGDGLDEVFLDLSTLAIVTATPELSVRHFDLEAPYFEEIALADLDGDRFPELAVGHAVVWLSKDGSADLGHRISSRVGTPDSYRGRLALGDFSGDGQLDLAIADNTAEMVWLARQSADQPGELEPEERGLPASHYVVLGDLDGDHRADAITRGNTEGLAFLDLDGAAPEPVCSTASDQWPLAIGDVTADGTSDLVVSSASAVLLLEAPAFSCSLPQVVMSLERPDHTIHPSRAIAIADMDHDGLPDVVVASDAIRVALQRGDAPGTFQVSDYEHNDVPDGSAAYFDAKVVDIDKDGLPDVAALGSNGEIRVFINNASVPGRLQPSTLVPDSFNQYRGGYSLALRDLQDDGLLDVVTFGAGMANVFLQVPDISPPTFAFAYSVVGTSFDTVLDDFDADGRADLVSLDPYVGTVLFRGR